MNSSDKTKRPKLKPLTAVLTTLMFLALSLTICLQIFGSHYSSELLGIDTQTPEEPDLTTAEVAFMTNMRTFELTSIAAYITQVAEATKAYSLLNQPAATQAESAPNLSLASPVEMALLNINTTTLPDGTVKSSAELSLSPLGLGSLHLSSPSKIKLGESSVIRLTITPDSTLSDLPQVSVPTISGNLPGFVLEFSDDLQIYPVMIAELAGINFSIVSDNRPEKPVVSNMSVEWLWSVTPIAGGKQSLILVISVPVIIDQARGVVSAQTLKNIPIEIQVEVTATPVFTQTPTPLPPLARAGEQIINNFTTVLVAVLTLVGVLIGAYLNYINNKNKPASLEPSDKKKSKKGK